MRGSAGSMVRIIESSSAELDRFAKEITITAGGVRNHFFVGLTELCEGT
jgi:hypothetical protein